MSRELRVAAAKIVHLIVVLLGVSVLVYLLLDLLPGDPAEVLVASSANPTPGAVEELRLALGLDKPLPVRYADWLAAAVQGDLGVSFRTGQPVVEAIGERLPVTIELLLLAEVLSLAVAVPLAVAAAHRRDGWFDRMATGVVFGLQSIPNFVIALVMIVVFAVSLRWLPALGFVPLSTGIVDNLRSLTIPTLALAAALIPVYTRVLRNEMVRTLQEDFIQLARSQGLPDRHILFRHALKPSMPLLVTVVGISVGTLVGGTIIVETICGLPGLGTLLFTAINNRDYVLVQGVVLFIAAAYVLINFLVDLCYSFLDPRVTA